MRERRLLRVLALGLALPSTVFAAAWGFMTLAKLGLISRGLGIALFLAVIFSLLAAMVYNACRKKHSP